MENKILLKVFVFVSLVLILLALPCAALLAETGSSVTPANFYKGRALTIILPYSAGGSQDLFARIIAPYLKEYTGATVVIKNRPGGGGTVGLNEIFRAKPNGLYMGCSQFAANVLNSVLEVPGVKYKVENWAWIGAMFAEPMIFCVPAKGPYKTIADLKTSKGLKFGAVSPLGNYSLGTMTAAHILGLDAKVITGFRGSANIQFAMQKGEIDGAAFTVITAMAGKKKGMVKPLFVLLNKRFPGVPDVPAISDLMSLNEEQKHLLEIWEIISPAKSVFAPPGVPEKRLAFLRDAWRKTIDNPRVRAKFEKSAGYSPVVSMTYSDLEQMTKAAVTQKGEIKRTFEDLVARYRMGL